MSEDKVVICPHPIKLIRRSKDGRVIKVYCEIDNKEFDLSPKGLKQKIGREIYLTGKFTWDTDCLTDEGLALRDNIMELVESVK